MPLSADRVIETLETAAEENQISHLREHQVVNLPAEGEAWMTGDLHDHRRNYEKLIRTADLRNHPQRHLILHELIHGDYFDATGAESSWITLYNAADLKCDFPEQVHFMLANHDLAQIHGEGIMKAGASVCEAFSAGVRKHFGNDADKVEIAIKEFLLSLPLAVRLPNGIFCCHSLPTDKQIETFDFTVFNRALTGPDYARKTGPVYQLIWGRNMTPGTAALFAEEIGAELLITGHQPQEEGFAVNGPQHLIVASDHNQGVYLPIDLSSKYKMDDLVNNIQRFAMIELGGGEE
jgi:hypothetical protein